MVYEFWALQTLPNGDVVWQKMYWSESRWHCEYQQQRWPAEYYHTEIVERNVVP